MSRIYLSSVQLTDFRSFGVVPPVNLHPGPGVLLLVGPNGLGKSSWFEAVEMALTGDVRRWSDTLDRMPHGAQARFGKERWSVQLRFQGADGATHVVARSGPKERVGTPLDEVISLLAPEAQEWSLSSTNLRSFLHMTHFLPQSSRLRFFAESDHRVRWDDWLIHVSGFERVARAQANVDGGTKGRLTRERERREAAWRTAKQLLERWHADRRALEESERASTHDAWSPARARIELAALRRVEALPPSSLDPSVEWSTLSEAVAKAREDYKRRVSVLAARRSTLEGATSLLAEWADAQSRSAEITSALDGVLMREKHAKSALESAVATVVELRILRTRATMVSTDASRLVNAVGTRLAAADRFDELNRSYQLAVDSLKAAREVVAPLQAVRQEAFVRLEARREWEALRASIARRSDELAEARARVTNVNGVKTSVEAMRVRDAAFAVQIQEQERCVEGWRRDEVDASRALRVLAEQVEAHRARNTAVAQAVAMLTSHLHEADTVCPLCAHDWEVSGALLIQARSALNEDDPLLVVSETALRRQQSDLGALRAKIVAGVVSIQAAQRERVEIAHTLARLHDELHSLLDHELLAGAESSDYESLLAGIEAGLVVDRTSWGVSLAAALPNANELESAAQALIKRLRAAETALLRCERTVVDAERSVAEAAANLEAAANTLRELVPTGETSGESFATALAMRAKADADLASVTEQLARAVEAQRTMTAEHAAIQEERRTNDTALAQVGAHATTAQMRWSALAIEGPASLATLEAAITDVERERALVADESAFLQRGQAALMRWHDDQVLSRRRQQLSDEAGGATSADWDEHEHKLESSIDFLERAMRRAEAARQAVESLSQSLDRAVTAFRPRLTESLAEPLRVLLPAMIQDEQFHDLGLRIDGSGKKSSVAMTVADHASIEAEHLLSEGQMSGVSLAVMLATANAFRWSRWPALLLDDPTQHNDLVHAANLIEVLRTMIVAHGFQIVISTHDRELAAFFQRKLRHANVPGRTCSFRDPNPDEGVIPSVTAW